MKHSIHVSTLHAFSRVGDFPTRSPPPPSLDSSPAPKHNMCSIYSGLLLVTRRGVYAYSHAELKIIPLHIQVYQVAKGGEGRGKFDMFGPQTATSGRIRSSIFFLIACAFED